MQSLSPIGHPTESHFCNLINRSGHLFWEQVIRAPSPPPLTLTLTLPFPWAHAQLLPPGIPTTWFPSAFPIRQPTCPMGRGFPENERCLPSLFHGNRSKGKRQGTAGHKVGPVSEKRGSPRFSHQRLGDFAKLARSWERYLSIAVILLGRYKVRIPTLLHASPTTPVVSIAISQAPDDSGPLCFLSVSIAIVDVQSRLVWLSLRLPARAHTHTHTTLPPPPSKEENVRPLFAARPRTKVQAPFDARLVTKLPALDGTLKERFEAPCSRCPTFSRDAWPNHSHWPPTSLTTPISSLVICQHKSYPKAETETATATDEPRVAKHLRLQQLSALVVLTPRH
ncbi:hypothetical protein LX36DRAFT_71768 [Colletotrichum falcatum]|nr:hypothetical protein LX36DRAFT_71768 [Colletotrichum falcatum]